MKNGCSYHSKPKPWHPIPVQILNPHRIYIPVKYDPLALVQLAAHIVDNLAQDVREQPVRPLPGVGVQHAVQVLLGEGLGVDDVGHALLALDALQGLEQDSPCSTLALKKIYVSLLSLNTDKDEYFVNENLLCILLCPFLIHKN